MCESDWWSIIYLPNMKIHLQRVKLYRSRKTNKHTSRWFLGTKRSPSEDLHLLLCLQKIIYPQ